MMHQHLVSTKYHYLKEANLKHGENRKTKTKKKKKKRMVNINFKIQYHEYHSGKVSQMYRHIVDLTASLSGKLASPKIKAPKNMSPNGKKNSPQRGCKLFRWN